MIAYSNARQTSITNAVKKARSEKPKVKPVADPPGRFEVCSSKGGCYVVTFANVNVNGEFTSDCTCKAGKAGRVCYHVVAAAPIHKQQVQERAAAKATAPVEPVKCYKLVCTDLEGLQFVNIYEDYEQAYQALKDNLTYEGLLATNIMSP